MSVDKKGYTQLAQAPEDELEAPPSYLGSELNTLVGRTRNTIAFAVQPVGQEQMTIGGARNPKALEVGLDGKRSWNHSLCSCCEVPGETLAAFCSNKSRLDHLTKSGEPIKSPQHVGLFCALYTIAPQFFGIGQVMMQCFSRLQTRQRYGIRGDVVQDTLVAAFCVPCSLVQESREIEDEEVALRAQSAEGQAPEAFYRDEEATVGGGESVQA
ncbi:hypothetical protein MNV49_003001 [Pseudohyphozyma bogoriensis]|nr:hypothetical protein MNV49_003001 [Pseudohyphozyma bogoriensis]